MRSTPIDDRVFEYEQLGLKDGERVLDRVDNIGYVYSNGELTEPRKYKVEAATPIGTMTDGDTALFAEVRQQRFSSRV